MQLKSYLEAIELYTCAIALDERNAVYYCNRYVMETLIRRTQFTFGTHYSFVYKTYTESLNIDKC